VRVDPHEILLARLAHWDRRQELRDPGRFNERLIQSQVVRVERIWRGASGLKGGVYRFDRWLRHDHTCVLMLVGSSKHRLRACLTVSGTASRSCRRGAGVKNRETGP